MLLPRSLLTIITFALASASTLCGEENKTPELLTALRQQFTTKAAAASLTVRENYKTELQRKRASAGLRNDLTMAAAADAEFKAVEEKTSNSVPKVPPEIVIMRAEFIRRMDEALQPVVNWYKAELQKEIRSNTQSGDVTVAVSLQEELTLFSKQGGSVTGLHVIKANFGAGEKQLDVTKQLQAKVANNVLAFKSPWGWPDVAPFQHKKLRIEYRWLGEFFVKEFTDTSAVKLP